MTSEEWAQWQDDWTKAQADFDNWPLAGIAWDGSPIRHHSEWGDGVFEHESGMVISPIAYAARSALRKQGVSPLGDKS